LSCKNVKEKKEKESTSAGSLYVSRTNKSSDYNLFINYRDICRILITKVFDKQLRIKSSDIKEWSFDGSMPSFSNSNKIRYVSSLYRKCTCESHSAYD